MKRYLLIAALLLGGLAPGAAAAQDPSGGQGSARCSQVPLSRVLAMIAQRTPGRHLNTTPGESGGRPAYFVQWQTANGRVMVFIVDACSGAMIGQQGG
jgi:uncharacterized membrane protein YkoI